MTAIAYFILQHSLIKLHDKESVLAQAIGKDRKGNISAFLYCVGIAASFINPWISGASYVIVALIWLIPDKRIEKRI